ncbi:restriction endonuclease subunit S [Bacillus halotolerans]|uniref:restriction endonuclease subunit S n=1 Tax=Bacillus halotolerans TaxID=260554 RepID=UPI00192C512F|nr:restriction endonuclease subunit S [Bacillus halotolerans]MBL4963226.1 restriction endonuclease subunit S [Bacillus halotolerans]MBT9248274.1 restriction endonuclease subunit S [Bacillus halotolerans]MEC1543474.1 restriction endonuclease subunit S [Bacillus halotolerans]
MDINLKPYEEYKETEYDWLGSVPRHWKEQTVRSITKLSTERNGNRDDLELLSVYREYGVIRKSSRDDNHNVESQDLSNYKFVDSGYLVLNKMKMWQGSLGVSRHRGIVSPAYIVCKLIGDLNYEYIHYLMRSAKFKTIYNRISYGVRVGQWDMRYDDFKNIKLFLPPITEQNQIVKYLDYQLAKINKFIQAKKKLITVLKEQKQVVINDAVTKGLNQNVKMQPTNINFIESVPAHWRKYRLKNLVSINGRIGFRGYTQSDIVNEGEGAITLSPGNIKNQKLKLDSLAYISWDKYYESPEIMVEDNDIVLVKTGSSFGKAILIKNITYPMTINPQLVLLKNCKAHPEYFEKILFSSMFMSQISRRVIGGATPTIGQGVLGDIVFYVPDLNEQKHIIKYINYETDKIDKSIATIEKEIELITEFRTSLISNVVTGKLDVRDIFLEDNGEVNADYKIIEEETKELEGVLESEECEV